MDIKTTYNVKKGTPESLTNFNKLSNKDLPLIQTQNIDTQFNQGKHRVDVHFYSLDGRLLQSKVNSTNYSIQAGSSNVQDEVVDIILDPQKDVIEAGYDNGDINVLYNFVNTLYSNSNTRPIFYVESISPDRREIRALTNDLSKDTIIDFTNQIKSRLEEQPYFEDFRTNFGKNKLPIAVNIETTEYKGDQAVLIRFYDTLPTEFTVKSTFLVEELIGNSVLYEVTTKVDAEAVDDIVTLRGANYNIELVEENNNPTGYLNYNELFSYPVTNSYYEVYSLFNEKGAQISIDHTDYSEFIQFSSAEERIRNFYYKASLLESYRNQIDSRVAYTASIEENIRGIVNNFDHFDRFLYFETGSSAWPKSSSTRPYTLYSTGSSEVQSWYTDKINSAALYDAQNQDRLTNTIPSFIREDLNNAPYLLFVDMIGQHFDNLWIYSKAVTSKYDADNRLDFGISKDLVRDAVENFGITLYNNNEALENLFSAFTGESYDSGSEDIRSLIVAVEGSGSLVGSPGNEHLQPMPKSSYQKEVYKRIYHNIPLLLKSKGTERGLRALINSLGIPSDTLSIKMYGGATESSSIFYGPETEFTSSLDKIRISNTDTVTTGSTLSNFSSVVQPGRDYSTDLHTVEVGFSPTDNLNRFIKAHPSMSSFNIDEYIGDPSLAYSSSYSSLDDLADTVFTSGSSYVDVYNAFDFVRLIKFFDNSLFRIIKDFVPARSNISTGIIIKPHLLDRSKVKQPEVKWSNQTAPDFIHTGTQLDYTGSYYSTNFSIDGNIETAFITGSTGLGSGYTSSYTETYANPSGGFQTLTRNNHDEASYTGEYSGSIVRVSNGELNNENNFKYSPSDNYTFSYYPTTAFSNISDFINSDFSSTDNITLWISEEVNNNFTASRIEALSIPRETSLNGDITPILENSQEIVLEYIKFIETQEYDVSNLEYEIEGGSYKASVDAQDNFIRVTHTTSAPYSASFSAPLADLNDGDILEFSFTAEFENYYASYLQYPFDSSKTPHITASILSGGTILDELSFSKKQGEYPRTHNVALSYKNDTGSPISNLEFFYEVNIPQSTTFGVPKVNLNSISILRKGDGTGFYNSGIEVRKRLKDAYYYDLKETIFLPSSSLDLDQSSGFYRVGFLPGVNSKFKFNDYDSTSNNIDSIRKSSRILKVDDSTYSPTQGTYTGFLVPGNYEIISSSIANGVQGLNERHFAEVQDSNYYATGWKNGRYEGTESNNFVGGFPVVGREPSLAFESFDSSLFDSVSTATDIKAKFTSSEEKTGDTEVYYTTYELNQGTNIELENVSSTETNSTLDTINSTTYSFNLANAAVGGGTYSGSIGPKVTTDRILVEFDVTLANINSGELDVAGLTVKLLENGNQVAVDSTSFNGAEFTVGATVSKSVTLSAPRNIPNATVQFDFTEFTGQGGGSPDVTLEITSLSRRRLLPICPADGVIASLSATQRTYFYTKVKPTPSSPNGFTPIIDSKLYRFGNNTVYTVNNRGIVTNIE